ncbi:MAG: hypothetical protein ACKOJF_29830, partial [Planctomycetaceae bacterium]
MTVGWLLRTAVVGLLTGGLGVYAGRNDGGPVGRPEGSAEAPAGAELTWSVAGPTKACCSDTGRAAGLAGVGN